MNRAKYVGDDPRLKGQTADIKEASKVGYVLAQFDDREEAGLWRWTMFKENQFELLETPVVPEQINHPHGGDTTYETVKVIEAWDLGFRLGNAVKYISRAGKKNDALEDLKKARWYLDREIQWHEAVRS